MEGREGLRALLMGELRRFAVEGVVQADWVDGLRLDSSRFLIQIMQAVCSAGRLKGVGEELILASWLLLAVV